MEEAEQLELVVEIGKCSGVYKLTLKGVVALLHQMQLLQNVADAVEEPTDTVPESPLLTPTPELVGYALASSSHEGYGWQDGLQEAQGEENSSDLESL